MICNITEDVWECDNYYPTFMQIMYIYVLGMILIFGFLGNILSLTIFEIQRRRKGSTTLVLLSFLCIADTLYLLSSIFSRMLPTISKYVYLGRHLAWSMHEKDWATAFASIFQAFAAYMVVVVTLHRYIIVTKPLEAHLWMSKRNTLLLVVVVFFFSIGFNIPRFFELTIKIKCNECLGVDLPVQIRTELGQNDYFNIFYTIIVRTICRGLVPIVAVSMLTRKITKVNGIFNISDKRLLYVRSHLMLIMPSVSV